MKKFNVGDTFTLTQNPFFSTRSRVGKTVVVVELLDKDGKKLLAFRDELGVAWPVNEYDIT